MPLLHAEVVPPGWVTNEQFVRFVEATGYLTLAERPLNAADFPGAPPENLVPGSMVFHMTSGPVDLRNYVNWWAWVPGACWRRPKGPDSSLLGIERHPVVHVAYEDAETYAKWAGKELPTEPEWERAARGGLDGAAFTWGDEEFPDGKTMANSWQGEFPWQNLLIDTFEGTSPVGSFPPNGYGLYDRAVARPSTHASPLRRRATTRRSRSSASRAKWSRAARTCALPTTACATGRRRASRRWWIRA